MGMYKNSIWVGVIVLGLRGDCWCSSFRAQRNGVLRVLQPGSKLSTVFPDHVLRKGVLGKAMGCREST